MLMIANAYFSTYKISIVYSISHMAGSRFSLLQNEHDKQLVQGTSLAFLRAGSTQAKKCVKLGCVLSGKYKKANVRI